MRASTGHHPKQVVRDDTAVWDLPFPVSKLSPVLQSLNNILIGFPEFLMESLLWFVTGSLSGVRSPQNS